MAEIDSYVERYLGYVDQIIAKIPYSRVRIWKEFFLNPVATVNKDQVGIGQRLKDLVVMGLIGGLIGIIAAIPGLAIGALASGGMGILFIALVPLLILVAVLISPLIAFVYSLLQLVIAKLLGGVGDMQANFNASALPELGTSTILLPFSVLAIPIAWLSSIPFVSICMLVVQIPLAVANGLVGLYGLYLGYLAMKEVHKLSTIRAVAVILIPPILLLLALAVVLIAVYAFLIATIVGAASAISAAN